MVLFFNHAIIATDKFKGLSIKYLAANTMTADMSEITKEEKYK